MIERQKSKMAALGGQVQNRKLTAWDLNQVLVVVNLSIVS